MTTADVTSPMLIVGQAVVDVTVDHGTDEPKLRHGGIVHAARALWAIGHPYDVAYIAPSYLDEKLEEYLSTMGAGTVHKIGEVTGAPNVMLIREPRECAEQGYEFLLRDELRATLSCQALSAALKTDSWKDVLIFGGQYDLDPVLSILRESGVGVHIDGSGEALALRASDILGRPLDTFILSTSSNLFIEECGADIRALRSWAEESGFRALLFKENRGGSRLFHMDGTDSVHKIPAQTRPIAHSVGVGDTFNAVYLALRRDVGDQAALAYASCIAAEYAATTYPEVFREAAQGWLRVTASDIVELEGISLPWEDRRGTHIYVAAPDFDFADTKPIRLLERALTYHNFSPRLPVQENGQMGRDASRTRRRTLYQADMSLLHDCSLLVAVLPYDDPGTLIEMGWALATGMPIIVYDPYSRAENLMVTESAELVSNSLDEVLVAVFDIVARLNRETGEIR